MFRRISMIAVLAGAVAGPYLATETETGRSTMRSLTGAMEEGTQLVTSTIENGYGSNAHHQVETLRRKHPDRYRYGQPLTRSSESADQTPQLVGDNVNDLREVMRFDITPEWVMQRFSRVSTVLADLQLEGLRVPVVTGTRSDDLAGTLTYYFDQADQLQRVNIHGFTGDPQRLVGAMTAHYGMTREPSLEAGVFTKRWNGVPVHFLRLTHAPVVYADAVHQKYTVFLELNDPNLVYGISHEAARIRDSDRMTGRW